MRHNSIADATFFLVERRSLASIALVHDRHIWANEAEEVKTELLK